MRSPQNTATTLARSWFVRGRLVGAAAIASAASVVIDNAVVAWAGAPSLRGPDQGGARLPRRSPRPRSRSRSAWRR